MAREKGTLKRINVRLGDYGIILIFFVLCLILSFLSPMFLTSSNIFNVFRQISMNGILAIGMTFVILTGGIDLSVGSVVGLAGGISASLASATFFPGGSSHVLVCVFVTLFVGLLVGGFNGLIISRFDIPAFIVTLGMMSICRGLLFIYSDGMPISKLSTDFLFIGRGRILNIPMPIILLAVCYLIAWIVLTKTRFGRYVYAVGGNERNARISGVNTRMVFFWVYAISGCLASLSGIILTARTTAGLPQAGTSYEMDAIAAVVIGGTSMTGGQGSLIGTLFGVLLIGVLNNGLDLLGVSSYYQQVVKGAIIILAVLYDVLKKAAKK